MSAPRKPDFPKGKRFGRLTVTETRRKPRSNGYTDAQSLCLCDCGNSTWISNTSLRRGRRQECRSCTTKRAWLKIPRLSHEELEIRKIHKNYIQSARKRNLLWELNIQQFLGLILNECFYCGQFPANGIDRKDNSQGYLLKNSVSCCSQCNYSKRQQTEIEFLNWVSRIAAKQGFSL